MNASAQAWTILLLAGAVVALAVELVRMGANHQVDLERMEGGRHGSDDA